MALTKDMDSQKIERFLKGELLKQLENDVLPVIEYKQESGFFGVPKQLLTFVDFLGAMRRGVTINKKKKCKYKELGTGWKAKDYLKKVLKRLDENYKLNGDLLYEMYRHGLIHEYQPKDLIQNKKVISWMPYKGERKDVKVMAGNETYEHVTHLEIYDSKKFSDDKVRLPVSVDCLYADVYSSVGIFLDEIKSYKKYENRWRTSANFLIKPKKFIRKEKVWV